MSHGGYNSREELEEALDSAGFTKVPYEKLQELLGESFKKECELMKVLEKITQSSSLKDAIEIANEALMLKDKVYYKKDTV